MMDPQLFKILLLALSLNTGSATDQPGLYFSLVVSSTPTMNVSGIVSAVDHALELINSDTTILPGYSLQYTQVLDTQCDSERASKLLRGFSYNESAIVGCGCSLVTEEIARRSDITVISYASTSVALSNRSMYPNLFRTVPSDESLGPALATLMQHYGWRTLSILTEQETQFISLHQLLNMSLSAANISVENSVQFNARNLSVAADATFKRDSRIIMLNTSPKSALFYLCKAFSEGRYYPGYVWITPGYYQQGWWKADENYLQSLNCTSSDIKRLLNRSLVLLTHPNTTSKYITKPYNSSSYAMDAVMTLAMALNETVDNPSLNLSLRTAIQNIKFSGTSGILQFDSSGNRLNPVVLLQQFRTDSKSDASMTLSTIAIIMDSTVMYINGETVSSIWPGLIVPPVITVINTIKTSVFAYVGTLVTIGLMLSVVCLMFTAIFHNRKIVKLTSPNLSYTMIVGVILLLMGNFLIVRFQSRNLELISILCLIEWACQTIGYDTCFVVALVKTARVVYIFRKVSPTKKTIKDWYLLLLSAAIIMIEVLYVIPLLTLIYVMGSAGLEIDIENPSFTNEQGYTVIHYVIQCASRGTSFTIYLVFLSLSVAYKVIIHIVGLVLAFLTRKVKIDSLNDSKYSTAIIYASCFNLALVIIITLIAALGVNKYAIAWTTIVFVEVCTFLGLTFIPKMVLLYKDPQGSKIFSATASSTSPGTNITVTGDQPKVPHDST